MFTAASSQGPVRIKQRTVQFWTEGGRGQTVLHMGLEWTGPGKHLQRTPGQARFMWVNVAQIAAKKKERIKRKETETSLAPSLARNLRWNPAQGGGGCWSTHSSRPTRLTPEQGKARPSGWLTQRQLWTPSLGFFSVPCALT